MIGSAMLERNFASKALCDGVTRPVISVALDDWIVIYESPVFFGNVNGPRYIAPASRMIVSPGAALLMAACRSPPLGTTRVVAREVEAEINKIKRAGKT